MIESYALTLKQLLRASLARDGSIKATASTALLQFVDTLLVSEFHRGKLEGIAMRGNDAALNVLLEERANAIGEAGQYLKWAHLLLAERGISVDPAERNARQAIVALISDLEARAAKAEEERDKLRPVPLGERELLNVRAACKKRIHIDGTDAQALEHALTITERERDEWIARFKTADEFASVSAVVTKELGDSWADQDIIIKERDTLRAPLQSAVESLEASALTLGGCGMRTACEEARNTLATIKKATGVVPKGEM